MANSATLGISMAYLPFVADFYLDDDRRASIGADAVAVDAPVRAFSAGRVNGHLTHQARRSSLGDRLTSAARPACGP